MKKILLIISCITLLSCKDQKKTPEETPITELKVEGTISYELLERSVECNGKNYQYSIPNFNSKTAADKVLNAAITGLITRDFIDVTYVQGTPLKNLFDTFTNRRERVLCREQKKEGLLDLNTVFVSDVEKFTSYELEYTSSSKKGRLLKTFLKPELKEIHLSDLIPEHKQGDIKIIFDANLQQAVANLINEIPAGDLQNKFIEYVRNTAFQFNPKDFESSGLAFQFNSDISKNLRLSKKVNLPQEFDFLNNTVIVEIDAYQLTHYLDLSRIIN
ncbi:hypothetical protein F0365_08630 [Nonlabens sp. Ci31]|jgi:hypothetical protein|uniref:hypothetical protein n=1 Tax=Nonlabens sp. Ci31 TaxID=2608253 RepID=UPI001463A0CC|nr:hypothetical protein [Nonlabens sp. Ci31]QJP34456.1 hypothetical protein F0365_08630 [Nonlabens sp. Ci31]